ncbi:MAG: chemotaxis protein CheW [Alphaproteobacteria bacterium]
MDDLLREFLTETGEGIALLDVELVKLEKNPSDPGLLGEIFRVVHTIKGTCGFLGLPRLEAVAHAAEEVLGRFRAGELPVTEDAVSLILESLDCIKGILGVLEDTEAEPPGEDKELIARLNAYAESADVGEAETAEPESAAETAHDEPPAGAEQRPVEDAGAPGEPAPAMDAPPTAPAPAEKPAAATNKPRKQEPSLASQSIRVGVELLEHLMTMVSELVLTRNQLLQMVRGQIDNEFDAPLQRLSHVTTELQEGVMKTRMQPIGNAWAKLPRIVRDLSVELGKKIELKMLGAETELDRQVLELIKDPLTHMVRNSADHGLEPPDERKAAGKDETGEITLNAYHEGGHIVIEISDDGKGLDPEKLKANAIEKGLAGKAELAAMSDQQLLQLILRPGFSTATKVTNVSGRGVGMDVVRTNVEKIGGTIELSSALGKGTTLVIKIPLTLAIVSALIVECRGERFAIPQISVVELVRASANSGHAVESVNGTPVLRLRDRLLPLISLSRILGIGDDDEDISRDAETFIVVSQIGTHSFGLIVDQVFDTEEIVVKPVAPMLRDIGVYSGNTILGDGSIVMILDMNGIAAVATQTGMAGDREDEATTRHETASHDSVSFLVFRAGDDTPKAVPLALVARLEEIERRNIERSDGKPVVQYREQLMPLICVDPCQALDGEGKTAVVVFSDRDRSMGLVVDEIIDIVDEELSIELAANRPGVVGSAVIATKTTDIIDAGYYLTQAFSDWFMRKDDSTNDDGHANLLLVDDSPFFRNMLAPLLTAAGYDVTMAEDGDNALKLLETGRAFDIIVSDIEMPGMDGFALARACRNDDRWKSTPIVALTSHTAPEDFDRGREVGFTDYVAKFDRDALLTALSQSLSITGDAA